MQIDNLPVSKMVNEDGTITSEWRNSLQQTLTQMQKFLSDNCYKIPMYPNLRGPSIPVGTAPLNTQSNLGALYHDMNSNSPSFNLQQNQAGSPNPVVNYQFVPAATFHTFNTLDDLNSTPPSQVNAKMAVVTDGSSNNKVFIGVGNGWQVITTTNP